MQKNILFVFLITATGLLFIFRLLYLQVMDSSYKDLSNNNAIKTEYLYPKRGYIYDRNGKLLVANQLLYNIMVIPGEVKTMDTLEFCSFLKISKEDFVNRLKKARRYSRRVASVFLAQVSKEDYAYLQEKMYKYQGFYVEKRSLRKYPLHTASNVLGYIGEVDARMIGKEHYYQKGDYTGIQGVEKYYEKELRGSRGVRYIQKDRFNREISAYKEGSFDTLPTPGKDLTLTLDIELQQYGEALMRNKRGGIVAIEPSTGEILSLITAPSYNPNLMVGRQRSDNFRILNNAPEKPMYDRGLQAQYPPGSPFKIVNGLIGLQEGVITEKTGFICRHGYSYAKNRKMRCHCNTSGVSISLRTATSKSCNSYFANTYRRIIEKYPSAAIGMQIWNTHVKSFGFGNFPGIDLPIGKRGLVPDSVLYNRFYGRKRWKAVTTISNAIGQGELLSTPIQLANMAAIIANRGFYYTPHVVKKIGGKLPDNKKFTTPQYTSIDPKHFETIIEAMCDVFEKGTAQSSKIKGIDICGKTGTVENFIKKNKKKIQLTDHSIAIAFAPKKNPKIALAIFVENGYWGSRWAAPIASLMIEKYLKGYVSRKVIEKKMLSGDLRKEYSERDQLKEH